MLKELGFCNGIENYSRILEGRAPGHASVHAARLLRERLRRLRRRVAPDGPADRRHVRGRPLAQADARRLRLPPAVGARQPAAALRRVPAARCTQLVFVSATPGPFELRHSKVVAEQLIRPTFLVDPEVELRETQNQIDDLLNEIRRREEVGERVLVTTLTKKMSEDLTDYLLESGVKARYLHSEIDTLERISDHPRAAARRVRRARRRQPAARGARPAGGVARRDPRRRQGGLPARQDGADPDDRPRGAQRQRQGDHVRGQADRGDQGRARRDEPPPREAARVQRGARHRRRCRSSRASPTSRSS